jgi:Dinitrogenase iron-molybdenum cofactor.
MKIAVASSDGEKVDQHFGQAKHFLIFQMGKSGLEFVDLREKIEPLFMIMNIVGKEV